MHPIVSEFVNSGERLAVILEKFYDKNQYLEVVFYKLGKLINVDEIDNLIFLEIDKAVVEGHHNPDLYLLFISYTIAFISRRKQFERAKVLESIGSSLIKEKIHPVLQSYFLSSLAHFREEEAKPFERDRLIKESLSAIDRKSPRYRTILYNLALLLTYLGRLKDLDKEDLELIDNPINDQHKYVCSGMKMINAIILGNYEEGFQYIDYYKKSFKGGNDYTVQGRINFLQILSGDFDEKNYAEEEFKINANICQALIKGNYEAAQKYYDMLSKGQWHKTFTLPFLNYTPLHIQLSLKNKGMARLLYQEMEKVSSLVYFDDLFLARLLLLEKKHEEARKTFKRLLENVNRYGAMNQLKFQLQFAKELTATDVVSLMNQINFTAGEKQTVLKIENTESKKINLGLNLLIGESNSIKQVKGLITKFAKLKEPVLIIGETGTGKELVARAIHEEGAHGNQPFLAINCGALTESLLQSELFGYVAGAFTGAQKERQGIFEAAGKGTVFLDEFGDISPQMQASLLRVLESNEIRLIGGTKNRIIECKIVVATNVDLQKAVAEKRFREDLYFRLTRFDIKLPPLRERKEDIPQLIEYFLNLKKDSHEKKQILSNALLEVLATYHWSGNIRELKNEIERLKILHSEKEVLNLEDFDFTRLPDMPQQVSKQGIKILGKKISKQRIKMREFELDHDKILNIVERGTKADTRIKMIQKLFQDYKKITRSQIVEITDINPGLVSKELQNLCKNGYIKRIAPTKSVKSHYFILIE